MNRNHVIQTWRPIVLYDGSCPLCMKEILHYRRQRGASDVDWINIHSAPQHLEAYGLTLDQTMRRMHVRDASGKWRTGARAFIALWQSLPRYRWLARLVGLPGVTAITEQVYRLFAARRYEARCRDGYCAPDQRRYQQSRGAS